MRATTCCLLPALRSWHCCFRKLGVSELDAATGEREENGAGATVIRQNT